METRTVIAGYLTLVSPDGRHLPEALRRSPPYNSALALARHCIRSRYITETAAEQAHHAGLRGDRLGPMAQAAAETWREAECICLHQLDETGAVTQLRTRLAFITAAEPPATPPDLGNLA